MSVKFLYGILKQVVFVRLMDFRSCGRLHDVALKGVAKCYLVEYQPDQDKDAEVLDPGLLDRLKDG